MTFKLPSWKEGNKETYKKRLVTRINRLNSRKVLNEHNKRILISLLKELKGLEGDNE